MPRAKMTTPHSNSHRGRRSSPVAPKSSPRSSALAVPTLLLLLSFLSDMSDGIAPVAALSTHPPAPPPPPGSPQPRPVPPGRLIVGYSHDPSGTKVRRAVEGGVNVICWSFVHFDLNPETSEPYVRTDLDLDAVRSVREGDGWESVLHVAAVGGMELPPLPPRNIGGEVGRGLRGFQRRGRERVRRDRLGSRGE